MSTFLTMLSKLRAAKDPAYNAPIETLGLRSLAEELALNLPQKTQRGDDLGRFMRKKGVTDDEIKALKLNDLFKQDRVTQDELVDHIRINRPMLGEEIYYPRGEQDIDFYDDPMSMEEIYGPDYEVEAARDEILYGGWTDRFSSFDEIEQMLPSSIPQREIDEMREAHERFTANEIEFDDLPGDLQDFHMESAQELVRTAYEDSPANRVQLTLNGEDVDGYYLQGSDDIGYTAPPGSALHGLTDRRGNPLFFHNEEQARRHVTEEAMDADVIGYGEDMNRDYTIDPDSLVNYQERTIHLAGDFPEYHSSHYSGNDYLAHYRSSDRVGPNGERVLFIEEVQSDRAQDARKKGIRDPDKIEEGFEAVEAMRADLDPYLANFPTDGVVPFTRDGNYAEDIRDALATFASTEMTNVGAQQRLARSVFMMQRQKAFAADKLLRDLEGSATADNLEFTIEQFPEEEIRALARASLLRQGSPQAVDYYLNDSPDFQRSTLLYNAAQTILKNVDHTYYNGVQDKKKMLQELSPNAAALYDEAVNRASTEIDSYVSSVTNLPDGITYTLQGIVDKYRKPIEEIRTQEGKVADAPFIGKTQQWNDLLAKQLLLRAEDEGYDAISFAPAAAQDSRYSSMMTPGALDQQYKVNLPSSLKRVGGLDAQTGVMNVNGFDTPFISMRQKGPEGLTAGERARLNNRLFTPGATTIGAAGLASQSVPGFNDQVAAVGEVGAAALTNLAAPFLTGPTSVLEAFNPDIPVDELKRRRQQRQDRVTTEIKSPLAQQYAKQAQEAVAPVLQEINQNPVLNALPFADMLEYGADAVSDLPERVRFGAGALIDSFGI
jgi:hypothetical protein